MGPPTLLDIWIDCYNSQPHCYNSEPHCYNSESDCYNSESDCYDSESDCYNSKAHCYNSQSICQIVWEAPFAARNFVLLPELLSSTFSRLHPCPEPAVFRVFVRLVGSETPAECDGGIPGVQGTSAEGLDV